MMDKEMESLEASLQNLEKMAYDASVTLEEFMEALERFAQVSIRVAGLILSGRSNNWRKLHGFPMIRRRQWKK